MIRPVLRPSRLLVIAALASAILAGASPAVGQLNGGEWTELTGRFPGVPEGTWVSRVEPSRHDPKRVYASFDGHRTNDFTPYVYVSDDGGGAFRSIAANLPTGALDFVHVVREDPRNENLLFTGTDVGVYASLDRGGSWRRFMESMPATPVHDLRIHPRDRELIAGTHGRSIWIVDIAPLQDLTGNVLADGAAVFEPAPVVSTLGGPAGAGLHTVTWNLQGGAPEAFRERPGESAGGGGRPDMGRMRELADLVRPGVGMRGLFGRGGGGGQGGGELVEPGSYTVTVKIGDRTLSRTLMVERVEASQ